MDGATKMNLSDTPHILTAREEKQVRQSIAKEAAVSEKHVAQAGKTLKSVENDEKKAEKVCLPIQVGRHHFDTVEQATQKAQQARDKAVKQEHSTAQALSDAQYKHDLAVADERKAANDLSVRIVIVVTRPSRTYHL
jgi:oligoendopeptidase F